MTATSRLATLITVALLALATPTHAEDCGEEPVREVALGACLKAVVEDRVNPSPVEVKVSDTLSPAAGAKASIYTVGTGGEDPKICLVFMFDESTMRIIEIDGDLGLMDNGRARTEPGDTKVDITHADGKGVARIVVLPPGAPPYLPSRMVNLEALEPYITAEK